MNKLKQYEFSIPIDEYIFNRFVKNKVKEQYKYYEDYKDSFPHTKCNFILRDQSEDNNNESKIYLWDISERKPLKQNINKE